MTPQEHSERRLAAIMFTDMVNYSELMQKDEAGTLQLLEDQQEIVNKILKDHGGRQIKTIGDAFFAQFDSILIALNCGVNIQETLVEFNSTRQFSQRINLRIGIHLGDVEVKDNDAYGDGVNIASRIEPFADAGGICITEDVYRQVMNKTEMNFRSIGKKELKNITYSPEVYKVILPWEDRRQSSGQDYPENKDRRGKQSQPTPQKTSKKKQNIMPIALGGLLVVVLAFMIGSYISSSEEIGGDPSRSRSIAVLPFQNLSDASGSDYFSDGITEDIISHLAEIEGLRVIARTSILQYKGTNKTVIEIAKELNVNTILEGSVRRAGDQVRVVTQLIDIKSDDHLWTQTYDKKLDDIFAVQTDIAQNIAASLEAKLSTKVQEKLASTPTTDTQAYDYYLKGKEQYYSYTMEGFRESVKFFSQALEIDPSYSLAYAGLGNAYAQIFYRTKDPTFSDLGYTAVNEALKQNPELAEGYKAKALLAHFSDKKTEALKLNMKAIELKPGYTEAIGNVGTVNYDLGDISQFIKYFKIFSASNPNHRFSSERIAIAYFMLNEVQIGLETAMEGIRKIPDSYECRNLLFHHYLNSGNSNKAKTILDELAKLRPNDGRISGLWSLYHLMASDFEKAREKALSTPNPNQHIKSFLAYAHKKLGNSDETEKILSEIESKALKELAAGAESYHQYFILARTHAMRNDLDKAVASLEDAINSGFRGYADDTNFLSWTVDPILSNARKKDGFIKLQERMEMIIDRERAEAGLTS